MSYRPMTAWLFGKLPSHGDFISRGLTPAVRDLLDTWLSDEMRLARETYGHELAERFDDAPPLLFGHRDGDGWEGGTLCPSVDSVGRRFPLLVARRVASVDQATPAARACIDAVYAAFAEGANADALQSSAESLDLHEAPNEPEVGWWLDGAQDVLVTGPAAWPKGLLNYMLEAAAP